MAKTATLHAAIEAEDPVIRRDQVSDGALGSIQVTMLTFPKNLEGSLTILGGTRARKIGGTPRERVRTRVVSPTPMIRRLVHQSSTTPPNGDGYGHKATIETSSRSACRAKPDTDGKKRGGRKSLDSSLRSTSPRARARRLHFSLRWTLIR